MTDENGKKAVSKAEAVLLRLLDPKTVNPFLHQKRKKSLYPNFNDRMTAMLIDSCWAFFLLGPFIREIHPMIYGRSGTADMPFAATGPNDYLRQLIGSGQLAKLMTENLITFAVTAFIVVAMWSYASATPGKWLMRMRIVNDGSYTKPALRQWWLRYAGLLLFIPGYFYILFDPKRRALHDLIARTVVVRVKHWRIADDGTQPHLTAEEIAAWEAEAAAE